MCYISAVVRPATVKPIVIRHALTSILFDDDVNFDAWISSAHLLLDVAYTVP